ncbi:hypothetical protein WME94_44900 [Sorangium sp. So ce429]
MNIRVTWRIATFPLALAGLSVVPLMGCDKVAEAQQDLCCSEFTPGADLAAVEWGLDGKAEVDYGIFMQAVSDFTGVAGAVVTDVASACRAIAIDLGVDPAEVTATEPGAQATAWCDFAVGKLANVTGNIAINFQPPRCTIDASVQANCEAKCDIKAECKLTPAQLIARCEPGNLSGRCTATCEGTCEGSANLAVNCEGTCQGTCEGECDGECSATTAGGDCRGACNGTCRGECRGSCAIEAGADVQCNADCTGGCSVEYEAPKCTAELEPPSAECNADADCTGSCNASASARADCKEPSVNIVATGDTDLSAEIATLRANLPRLLLVAQARGKLLAANAEAVFNAAGNVDVTGSVKAGACIIPATNAITQAVENIEASVTASGNVLTRLEIGSNQ